MTTAACILVVNGGSSSLKAATFEAAAALRLIASATVERIGGADPLLTTAVAAQAQQRQTINAPTHEAALDAVLKAFGSLTGALAAAGHRVVHGGPACVAPQAVTAEMLQALRQLEPYDPEHLPAQLQLIEILMQRLPTIPHVACFDTAFHHDLPPVARRLPLPRKFDALGIRRYGFHGISYAYLMDHLQRIAPAEAHGRVVLAHLGNGASLAAVRYGRCIDTTMAFTPASGIPMGTRSGDLDPGLVDYLARTAGFTPEQFNRMVHSESGLLGISETTGDMQQLLELESTDVRAAEAVGAFCYHVRKAIGAYAAALGGLDTLVFAGGIGEHAAPVRARICQDLRVLGIELNPARNGDHAPVISSGSLPVAVRVISTDEQLMIARSVLKILADSTGSAPAGSGGDQPTDAHGPP